MSDEIKTYRTIVMGPKRKEASSYKLVEKIMNEVKFPISRVLWNKDWGFSTLAVEWARGHGISVEDYKIIWKSGPADENGFATNDNEAGNRVNGVMVRNADALIAVLVDNLQPKLLLNCIGQAKTAGLMIQVFRIDSKKQTFKEYPVWKPSKEIEKLDEITEQYPATDIDGSEKVE